MGKSSIILNTPRFIATKEINQNSPIWFKQHSETDYTEIMYIQGGNGHFIFEEKHLVGQEGDLIIFNPFSNIEGKSCPDNPLKGISVSFSNSTLMVLKKVV